MPAPSTIVTFTDAEGDEFPVRIWAVERPDLSLATIKRAAWQELGVFVENGELRPTMPVRITKVEEV
jgi:hypothetical protein